MEPKTFKFEIGQSVAIACSGERGIVIGRAQYQDDGDGYFVRYCSAIGTAASSWWAESALVAVEVAAKAPDPTTGFATDRSVAAPTQEVGDETV